MVIKKVEKDKYITVYISGDLDAVSVIKLQEMFNNILENNIMNVILNLEELRMISSQCIGIIMTVLRDLRNNNGDMVICSIPQNIDRIFKTLGFKKIFKFFETEEEAENYFEKG